MAGSALIMGLYAVCRAGCRCFSYEFAVVVACSCNHPAVWCDFKLTLCITEVLAASAAAPVSAVSCCLAGRCCRRVSFQFVSKSSYHPTVLFDLSVSCFITEILAASVTAPVCAVSCCGAGGCYCCMCCHAVTKCCDLQCFFCCFFLICIEELVAY